MKEEARVYITKTMTDMKKMLSCYVMWCDATLIQISKRSWRQEGRVKATTLYIGHQARKGVWWRFS